MRARLKRIALFLLATVLIVYGLLRWAVELPGPSGPHAVGEASLVVADTARTDPWSGHTSRELLLEVFYPAASSGPRAAWFPQLGHVAHNFEGPDGYLVRLLPRFLSAHSSLDAPAAATKAPWPVVLFSPGAGTPIFCYRTFLEDLASRGYVVVAVEPTHEGVGQVFPDGVVREPLSNRYEPQTPDRAQADAFFRRRIDVRAADLAFVVRALEARAAAASADPWNGQLRLDRCVAFGHSLGGIAAVEAARRDSRIVAAVNLDGHFLDAPCLPDESPTAPRAAMLVIEDLPPGLDPPDPAEWKKTRVESVEQWRQRQSDIDGLLSRVFGRHERLQLAPGRHSDFSDEPFYYPRWRPASSDPALQRLAKLRNALTDFFARSLGESSTVVDPGFRALPAEPLDREVSSKQHLAP
ncbi:MAG: alpha/beta fold hydrolase [Pirellulales bacterium]|nr:alpha/beta fold hydrolase [Pirellulales bacterium]